MSKFVFITGGVVSSLGKGITAASLGCLLKYRGYKVSIQKFDPYINVDPGTMSPYQHGEVFVTDDGAETDLDLGHYERFIDETLTKASNVTSGRVYKNVIDRERAGEYLGATIQVIPHITNEIKKNILAVSRQENAPDVVITEIGGTVGDIESLPFLEAIRQLHDELGENNCIFIHVTLIPYIGVAGELKTKPTQHSVRELCSIGINPDILVCRCDRPMSKSSLAKLSMFCNLPEDQVFLNQTVDTIYEIPLVLHEYGLDSKVCELLEIEERPCNLSQWKSMVNKLKDSKNNIKVAIVGKYVELPDAYLSIVEAIKHASLYNECKPEIKWISAEKLNDTNVHDELADADAIIIPGGFGERGLDGKIVAAKYARVNNVPFLGICLGMQVVAIEFARNVLNWRDANTTEVDPNTTYPVIDILKDQHLDSLGGTMRLGAYQCNLVEGTKSYAAYGTYKISERHRHRYEFNKEFIDKFVSAGMCIAGKNPGTDLIEILEMKDHPFYVAVQFHPEYKSRPINPHPLFKALIKAGIDKKSV